MNEFLARLQSVVQTRADQVAVEDGVRSLTFSELNRAAGALAAQLPDNENRPLRIGFFCGPTVDRAVFRWTAIRLGATFIHIDPNTEKGAFEAVAAVCEIDLVVTTPDLKSTAGQICDLPIITFDPFAIKPDAPLAAQRDIDPDVIAGILFTSGSTGTPKCVPISYAALDARLNLRMSQNLEDPNHQFRVCFFNYYRFVPELELHQIGARISYFDLRNQGVVAAEGWLRDRKISFISAQVAIFRQICRVAKTPFPDVRIIDVVGDLMHRPDLERFERLFPAETELHIRFSSTEHNEATRLRYRRGDQVADGPIPLGKTITPDFLRLVIEDGRDAGPGEQGELLISGPMLASDYLGDPIRSAEVYFNDPVKGGERTCRTGFLMYQDDQGVYYPVGRVDDTAKVRGYTVRFSEVEGMLNSHPNVAAAVTRVFSGPTGVDRLVAYIQPKQAPAPSVQELREHVRGRAADYLTPSLVIPIDAFEFGPTGKIIRSALPDAMAYLSGQTAADMHDMTPSEQAISSIFQLVLGGPFPGPDDDFFDLGGDSLQITSAMVAIEADFGQSLSLESFILEGASPRAIAARLEAENTSDEVILKRGASGSVVFAAHQRGGHLSDYLQLVDGLAKDQLVIGNNPRLAAPRAAMRDIAAESIAVLRRRQPEGPYRLIGFSYGGYVAAEMSRQLADMGAEVSHLVLIDTRAPWLDPLRHIKAIWRPFRRGDIGGAWRYATQTIPMTLGLRAPPAKIEDAHRIARLRLKPTSVSAANTLYIAATHTHGHQAAIGEWRRLSSAELTVAAFEATHMQLVEQPSAWAVAQRIQAFLDAPA